MTYVRTEVFTISPSLFQKGMGITNNKKCTKEIHVRQSFNSSFFVINEPLVRVMSKISLVPRL